MKHEILQSCPPIIRDFLTYNETIKGKSTLSVEGYFLDLQNFFRYLLTVRGLVDKNLPFEKIEISNVTCQLPLHISLKISFNIENELFES